MGVLGGPVKSVTVRDLFHSQSWNQAHSKYWVLTLVTMITVLATWGPGFSIKTKNVRPTPDSILSLNFACPAQGSSYICGNKEHVSSNSHLVIFDWLRRKGWKNALTPVAEMVQLVLLFVMPTVGLRAILKEMVWCCASIIGHFQWDPPGPAPSISSINGYPFSSLRALIFVRIFFLFWYPAKGVGTHQSPQLWRDIAGETWSGREIIPAYVIRRENPGIKPWANEWEIGYQPTGLSYVLRPGSC